MVTSAPPIAERVVAASTSEPVWARRILIGISVGFSALFILVPLAAIFGEAFSRGLRAFGQALVDPKALSAIKLTLITTAIVVPLNLVFGVSAAWAIARFRFWGRSFLISLIDLPLAVSPVIAGMVFVLLFGSRGGFLGPWFAAHGVKIIFGLPGIVLATTFVTFPFIARELIPLMEAQGSDEEQAAVSLGAGGWTTFRRITLPNIKWGLLYGVLLCSARALGEFGAVAVVAG
ncbi:MAG TPA: sulfate ABC transporter permease subunit, partial [Kofleriaceae bacterium]|nr:sulfate ABC transporter permease subunit [Kofleriaceae bacterium]